MTWFLLVVAAVLAWLGFVILLGKFLGSGMEAADIASMRARDELRSRQIVAPAPLGYGKNLASQGRQPLTRPGPLGAREAVASSLWGSEGQPASSLNRTKAGRDGTSSVDASGVASRRVNRRPIANGSGIVR